MISGVGAGGAERVMTAIANFLVAQGDEVTLITFGSDELPFYPLTQSVQRIELDAAAPSRGALQAIWNNSRLVWRMRRAVRRAKPDIVVSFMTEVNIAALLATVGMSIPIVVSERIYPPAYRVGVLRERLRRMTYPWATAVVVQSELARKWALETAAARKAVVIFNSPSETFVTAALAQRAVRETTVVAMGRLTPQKGFDVLIGAFRRVHQLHPDWTLEIAGSGEEFESLRSLAEEQVPGAVQFLGTVNEAADLLSRAGVFVMSSRFEGFPNALLEAMTCGCAVVATDCATGPRDLIRDEYDGILVPVDDAEAMADAINALIADPSRREVMGTNAMRVRERFAPTAILTRWRELLQEATDATARAPKTIA